MMKKLKQFYLWMLALLAGLCLYVHPAGAAYSFEVPRAETTVRIESDGTFSLDFIYQFTNHGQPIDYVDIGLPSNDFKLSDVAVFLNEKENTSIKKSYADYKASGVLYGLTLEMGKNAIPSDKSATVEVTVRGLRKNLYVATSEKSGTEASLSFVGFQYMPNYFNSRFVTGKTHYQFTIIFPEMVDGTNSFYYTPKNWPGEAAPRTAIRNGHVVYIWEYDTANMGKAYTFGGKFPRFVLTTDANINPESAESTKIQPTAKPTSRLPLFPVIVQQFYAEAQFRQQ